MSLPLTCLRSFLLNRQVGQLWAGKQRSKQAGKQRSTLEPPEDPKHKTTYPTPAPTHLRPTLNTHPGPNLNAPESYTKPTLNLALTYLKPYLLKGHAYHFRGPYSQRTSRVEWNTAYISRVIRDTNDFRAKILVKRAAPLSIV